MIRAHFAEPVDDPAWKRWRDKAAEGALRLRRLVEEGKSPDITSKLYKDAQRWILPAFHDKCAYCEVKITADQIRGEVEHYRPKGAVSDANGKVVFIGDKNERRPHPGYYWLAYEWPNLLPACISCNRPSKADGKLYGKSTRFPVVDDDYRWHPDHLEGERPVLLNPWFDDPNEHLGFTRASGVIFEKTPRGRANIDILGLNRDALVELRQRAYRAAALETKEYCESLNRSDTSAQEGFLRTYATYKRGEADFCAFRLAAVKWQRDLAMEGLKQIDE